MTESSEKIFKKNFIFIIQITCYALNDQNFENKKLKWQSVMTQLTKMFMF